MFDNLHFYRKHYPGRHNQLNHGNHYAIDSQTGNRIKLPREKTAPLKAVGKTLSFDTLLHSHLVDSMLSGKVSSYIDMQSALYHLQGYNGKPHVVSEEQLQGFIRKGEKELFRGIEDQDGKAEQFAEDFRSGDFHAGKGSFGNGTYTAYGKEGESVAEQYKSGEEGAILHMSLRPDAKVISYDDLDGLLEKSRKDMKVRIQKVLEDENLSEKERTVQAERLKHVKTLLFDSGRFAVTLGYDAIDIGGPPYLVVLNRTAIRVAKKETKSTFFAKHLQGQHNQLDHGQRHGGIDMQSEYNALPTLPAKASYLKIKGQVWRKNLTGDEEEAIESYTGEEYATINDAHRSGSSLEPEIQRISDDLDDALEKSEAPADMIVYRGMSRKILNDLHMGSTLHDKGFVSTSIDDEEARKGFGVGKILATINIPKGSKGGYVAPISPNPDELEWLLPRNAKFKVLSVPKEIGGFKTLHVSLLYLGTETKHLPCSFATKAKGRSEYFAWQVGDISIS